MRPRGHGYFEAIGLYLTGIGFALFSATFWLNGGVLLAGDPYVLGPFRYDQALYFPWCGFALLMLFLGRYLEAKQWPSHKLVNASLAFLLLLGIMSLFSIDPKGSMIYLLAWALGFLALGASGYFWLRTKFFRRLYAFGLGIGLICFYLRPELVNLDLLAIGLLWLGIITLTSALSDRSYLYAYLAVFGLVLLQDLSWILVLSLWWGTSVLFLSRRQRRHQSWHERALFGGSLLALGIGWWTGWLQGVSTNVEYWFLLESFWDYIAGIGPGQYFTALTNTSPYFLTPENITAPTLGITLTFLEQGLLGIVLMLILISLSTRFIQPQKYLPALFILVVWVLSPNLWSTGAGIMLGLLLLCSRPSSKIIH